MGYHIHDFFHDYLEGKDFEAFCKALKEVPDNFGVQVKLYDFIKMCIKSLNPDASYLSVIHDLLLQEYDDASISVKQGKEQTSIDFVKDE